MPAQITPLFPVTGTDAAKVQGFPVSTLDPVAGQTLVYDEATKQWVPSAGTAISALGTAAARNVTDPNAQAPFTLPDLEEVSGRLRPSVIPRLVMDNLAVEFGRSSAPGNLGASTGDFTSPRRIFTQLTGYVDGFSSDGEEAILVTGPDTLTSITLSYLGGWVSYFFGPEFSALDTIDCSVVSDGPVTLTDLPLLQIAALPSDVEGLDPHGRLIGTFPNLVTLTGRIATLPTSAPLLNYLSVYVTDIDTFYNALVTLTDADDGYVDTNGYGSVSAASLDARNALIARGWTIVL